MIREHFYFSGRVQGVGFRYQAIRLARSCGLTGYVRNHWDGRVEMELQGEERMIREVIDALHSQPYIRIGDINIEEMEIKDGERGFSVKG
ncbi:MAG: acylphosphatase [Clostridiales bacterium]|nr:acylphosphatase [Clostridiales bacterium]